MKAQEQRGHWATLDGLRALAVGLVVIDHGFTAMGRYGMAYDAAGASGVDIFFVLSGFLITTLLLRERQATGGIRLSWFYARRAWRILPAAGLYLAVLATLNAVGLLHFAWHGFVGPVTMTTNFLPSVPVLGHYWSLAVEEQYYLMWPLVLLTVGPRWAARLAAGVWLGMPIWFYGLWHAGWMTVAQGVAPQLFIAAGCWFALARDGKASWTRRQLSLPQSLLMMALAVSFAWLARGPWSTTDGRSLVELVVVAGLVGLLVLQLTNAAPGSGWLAWRPVVWLGRLSYSIYLWQQVCLINPEFAPASAVWRLLAIVPCAALSYYLVERPCLSFKQRFAPRREPLPTTAAAGAA